MAGRHITAFLVELLQRRGYSLNKSADFDTVRQLKEKTCFVALDYAREAKVHQSIPPEQCFSIFQTIIFRSAKICLVIQPGTSLELPVSCSKSWRMCEKVVRSDT